MTPREVIEKMPQVAALMGGYGTQPYPLGWTFEEDKDRDGANFWLDREPSACCHYLIGDLVSEAPDNIAIRVSVTKGKINLSGRYPVAANDFYDLREASTIGLNPGRKSELLARDIVTRLVPDVRIWLNRCVEWITKEEARKKARLDLLDRLHRALGTGKPQADDPHRPRITVYLRDNMSGEMEPSYNADSVKVEFNWMPPDMAEKVAQVIGDELKRQAAKA